jgi:zinc transporter
MTDNTLFPNHIEWLDLDGNDPQIANRLEQQTWVPARARTLLLDANNPAMYRSMEDGTYLSLFGDLISSKDTMAEMRGIHLYITVDKLISVRWGLRDIVREVEVMAARRKVVNYTGYGLLPMLAIVITQRLSDDIQAGTRLGEDLEFNPREYHNMSATLGELRWNLYRLNRRLDPLATVLRFISTNPSNQIPDADEQAMRAAADYIDLNLKTLSSNQARSDLLQERLANQTNEKFVHSSYRLTVVATVFLPLTFITGLLGMNVAGIPENHDPFGFWFVSGLLLGVGILSWSFLNRKNPIRPSRKQGPNYYARIKRKLTRTRKSAQRRSS